MEQIHATCIAVDIDGAWTGVLLRGPSGCGKSDLALRVIEAGARLIADDRTDLSERDGAVVATAPPALAGLIEVRGLGILRMEALPEAAVGLVVDLVAPDDVERLPEPETTRLVGRSVAAVRLTPFEISAPTKVRLAAAMASGTIMRADE